MNSNNCFRKSGPLSDNTACKTDEQQFATLSGTGGQSSLSLTPRRISNNVFASDDIIVADAVVTEAPYNADPNGLIDSTSAIQKAIDDCCINGGGTVWMPSGTYKVTNTIIIKNGVTLRGDWRDPDTGSGSYGTLVNAELPAGEDGPNLFVIKSDSGIIGITVFYPNQNATSPIPYNYTFYLPGDAASQTYWAYSLINCTMLNSYKGVGFGTGVHSNYTIRNLKGTCLYRGIESYNDADWSTVEYVTLNNSYWANAGPSFNAPAKNVLDSWTKANGVGYLICGDVEWNNVFKLSISDYNIGIQIIKSTVRPYLHYLGNMTFVAVNNCGTAVKVEDLDTRGPHGLMFLRSSLNADSICLNNTSSGNVLFTDCTVSGAMIGNHTISNPGTSPSSYSEIPSVPKPTGTAFIDAVIQFGVPFAPVNGSSLPQQDATLSIQNALNAASSAGGGVVYLRPGMYRINTSLNIPANVELRGAIPVAQKCANLNVLMQGTYLVAYGGHNTSNPMTDAALITLNGNLSGLYGLKIFYPGQNPSINNNTSIPYPFTIRGNGSNIYVRNVELINSYNGIDLNTYPCQNHYIKGITGVTLNYYGIFVGGSTNGWIENIWMNANSFWCEIGNRYVQGWVNPGLLFEQIINPITKVYARYIVLNGASNEKMRNVTGYGGNINLWVTNSASNGSVLFNGTIDNAGAYGIYAEDGCSSIAANFIQYNGYSIGNTGVTVYNGNKINEC